MTPALRSLAQRCRSLFGLVLFGIDCVIDAHGTPLVVDVNDFPNYRGIDDDVDETLAGVILQHLRVRPTPMRLVTA